MKFAFFDDFRLGVIKGDGIVDVSAIANDIPHVGPQDILNGMIERYGEFKPRLEKAANSGTAQPVAGVRLRAPVPKPGSIDCMAVNYMENGTLKEKPLINAFSKASVAVIGSGDTMVLPDIPATTFEGEAEIACVIGKRATRVAAKDAMSHIFGYFNFIDGSARGMTPHNLYLIKSRDTFAPMGPILVTADEIPNPQNLRVRAWVNGKLMQDYNTDDMAHDIARSIEWLSALHTLEVGDVVAFGTNHRGLTPFQDGDRVEMEVEGLGRLRVNVFDELKRTWPRETRLDRLNRGESGPSPQAGGKYAAVAP